MKNNHLTYFKIENFKKFEFLELNDIGQLNLIVGDNNVGKTCLLEALLFDEDGHQMLNNFYKALTKRGLEFKIERVTKESGNSITTSTLYPKENYFKEYIFGGFNDENGLKLDGVKFNFVINEFERKSIELKINEKENVRKFINESEFNKNIPFEDYIKQFIRYKVDYNDQVETYWIYNYNLNILNFPLISFNDTASNEEAIVLYNKLSAKEEDMLLNALKTIDENIENIKFKKEYKDIKDVFLLKKKEEFTPLNNMGDGFKRIFYIILKALSLKEKRILIDEVEIGIHYSKMKDFWVNLMKVCKELEVQLFATTHSNECIEAFWEASKELNEKDIRLIRLQENKDKSIKAICYKEEYIEYMVESNTEER